MFPMKCRGVEVEGVIQRKHSSKAQVPEICTEVQCLSESTWLHSNTK